MPQELPGSKTEANLLKAFAGESEARNKYTIYAKIAKKEGYEQIAAILLETAENERVHAKLHFRYLGKEGTTLENLFDCAEGENYEAQEMYPEMAETAREEGFVEIAEYFEGLVKVEAAHEERFKKLIESLDSGTVFAKSEVVTWKCRECGFLHEGTSPLDICPVCSHPKAFAEVVVENF